MSHGKLLISKGDFKLFQVNGNDAPKLIEDIGRARARTFKKYLPKETLVDTDKYDHFYEHLYLIHSDTQEIIGAYRAAIGYKVYNKYGRDGFYLNELFHFDTSNDYLLRNSMEMGRSFVVPEYQQQFLPLMMLWRGLFNLFKQDENLLSIIGAVSIPQYSNNQLVDHLVDFLTRHYPADCFVQGKNELKLKGEYKFDNLLSLEKHFNIEGEKIPVLIKKYLDQNARIAGFNIDHNFGDAIDVLAVMTKGDMPEEKLNRMLH